MEVCTTHMFDSKNYEKMIFVRLNFINMFTKYVYLKYQPTLTHNSTTIIVFLYEIMWYDHQFLRPRDTFVRNRQTCKNVLVVHVLRIHAGKNRKTKDVGTCKPGASVFLRLSFLKFFFQIRKT
jgi:hypothetical protein